MGLTSKDIYEDIVRRDIEKMTSGQSTILEESNPLHTQEIIQDIVSRDIETYSFTKQK